MEPIKFSVLGKPGAKGRPRARVAGKKFAQVYTDAKTKAAEESFLAQALPYRPVTPLEGPLRVEFMFVMPIPKSKSKVWKALALSGGIRPTGKPDCDNLAKLALDSLNGVFFEDDAQVVELRCSKIYGEIIRTDVFIEEVTK